MFERCLYFNTNSLARNLNSVWEKKFSQLSLPPSHAYLLRLVLQTPGLTQQEITKELRLNKSTVTRFIFALEKKDLLERKETIEDQRQRIVIPTEKALSLHQELEALGDELYSSMCETLGRDVVESFVKTARLLNEKL